MTTEHIPWHEYVTDPDGVVAEYVDDNTSEVYDTSTDAPYFVRVREDDQTFTLTLLTNDQAELIAGEARLSGLPEEAVAVTILGMLSRWDSR